MFKKVLGSKSLGIILLAAGLALGLAACGGGGDEGTPPPGAGTSLNPYEISEQAHLKYMEKNVASFSSTTYFKLMNNIALTDKLNPIGNSSRPFRGIFDGDNKTISNLSINLPESENVGLFGWIEGGGTEGGTVKNLKVVIGTGGVTGKAYVGGIVGGLDGGGVGGGAIIDCSVTGNVTGTGGVPGSMGGVTSDTVGGVGGIAGGLSASAFITRCSFAGVVSSDIGDAIGGIAGYVHEGYIDESFATGTVSGYDSVGGVGGYLQDGWISDCYSLSTVSGNDFVGGVVGMISSNITSAVVSNCYATGSVSGSDSVGGVAGIVYFDIALSIVDSCAALNLAIARFPAVDPIKDPRTKFGMVAGHQESSSLTNNVAYILGWPPSGTLTGINGTTITKADATTDQTFYVGTLGWDFGAGNPWKWSTSPATYPLPILNWQTTAPTLPAGHPLLP